MHPYLPFPGWEAVSTWERKCGLHSQSPDSRGRHPHLSLCLYFSTLFWRQTRDLALTSFFVHHCENFLGSLSIFPLLLPQALINLFGASPGTPSNSYKSKESSQKAESYTYGSTIIMVQFRHSLYLCEASTMRSFFTFVPIKPWCQWRLLKNFHGDRNSNVLHLAEGKEKCLELWEKIWVSGNIKAKSWFIHFSRAHFEPEKDKFCFSLEQRRKYSLRALHLKWKATKGTMVCIILKTLSRRTGTKVARNDGWCTEEGGKHWPTAMRRMVKACSG